MLSKVIRINILVVYCNCWRSKVNYNGWDYHCRWNNDSSNYDHSRQTAYEELVFFKLEKGVRVVLSDSGYINKEISLIYLDHMILRTNTGLEKPPKVLLIDRHGSYMDPEFILKATAYNTHPYPFPGHLTHVLQPFDVGVFLCSGLVCLKFPCRCREVVRILVAKQADKSLYLNQYEEVKMLKSARTWARCILIQPEYNRK